MVAGEDGRQLVEEYIADIVSHVSLLGQSEKKNVSGVAPGWVKKVATGFFFFFKTGQYFLTKKQCQKKRRKMRPPDWPRYRSPATPETDFV